MNLTPQPADRVLDSYFLEARSKLLDLAAILDRFDRGDGAEEVSADPRLDRIRQALQVLLDGGDARAAEIQQVFSLAYDPSWKRPTPR